MLELNLKMKTKTGLIIRIWHKVTQIRVFKEKEKYLKVKDQVMAASDWRDSNVSLTSFDKIERTKKLPWNVKNKNKFKENRFGSKLHRENFHKCMWEFYIYLIVTKYGNLVC